MSFIRKKDLSQSEMQEHIIISANSRFDVLEAYKALRANLGFALHKPEGCRKIAFSSSFMADGKSTTAVNSAVAIAQTGAKVLLIDCDLRKPTVHRFFKLKNTVGLSNYLEGSKAAEDIITETEIGNLSLIAAGTIPPNPSELLTSDRFSQLAETLSNNYDYIIYDTPPVCIVSDALTIAQNTDGVILVVRQNYSVYPRISDAIEAFEFAGIKILGFILNAAQPEQSGSYLRKGYGRYGYKKYKSNYTYEKYVRSNREKA